MFGKKKKGLVTGSYINSSKDLGELLKTQRILSGLSQDEFARKNGTKAAYISRNENGNGNMCIEQLIKYVKSLNKKLKITIE